LTANLIPPASTRRGGPQAQENTSADSVQSDASGRFTLQVPSAGEWRLTASGRGFRSQEYEEHDGFFSAVVLTDAAPSIDLTFRLEPDAEIEGTVLDEAGDPVRNATVNLLAARPASPELLPRAPQSRGTAMTDDRGHYDFADLAPGDYFVALHARPWYASPGILGRPGDAESKPNPLDVVYPAMWYPDVTDFSAAASISLQAGDHRDADFHPLPQQAFSLRIPAPADASATTTTGLGSISYATALSPDGTQVAFQGAMLRDAQGNWDLLGLAPGSYEVHSAGASHGAVVEVSAASPHLLDLNNASPLATVTIVLDAAGDVSGLQVNLVDMATGRSTIAQEDGTSPPPLRAARARGTSAPDDAVVGSSTSRTISRERSIQLQPGSYQVLLNGTNDRYLSGMTASGAETTGRIVHLHAGPARLELRVASGRASLSGVARLHGAPVVAATVLLVPATLGDPRGMTTMRREQTNTDGSFDLDGILPGAYILLAIDHGWTVNWRDPATLRRYLMGGIAIDIAPAAEIRREILAQNP
jgi:protocatechuate 3,4-dioxygenase beta subunit